MLLQDTAVRRFHHRRLSDPFSRSKPHLVLLVSQAQPWAKQRRLDSPWYRTTRRRQPCGTGSTEKSRGTGCASSSSRSTFGAPVLILLPFKDTRLLPWAKIVISPSLRDPDRQFSPLTVFNFEARVEPAFMPMRIEARIVGVARVRPETVESSRGETDPGFPPRRPAPRTTRGNTSSSSSRLLRQRSTVPTPASPTFRSSSRHRAPASASPLLCRRSTSPNWLRAIRTGTGSSVPIQTRTTRTTSRSARTARCAGANRATGVRISRFDCLRRSSRKRKATA